MKSIIQSVLVKHLGKYIDGLKNSLDIGLLDGEVTIQNVSLKQSFFNQMGLPLSLRFSHIQKIHIDIPWTSLKDKSTIVTVRGIYALFSINYENRESEINASEILKGMIERIRLQMKKKWSQSGKQQTFAQKNLIRIVDNAVVKINNIHVRVESFRRNWDYSIGVILDDISSYTIDQFEEKTFYKRSFSKKQKNLPFNKILNLPTFQVYHNDEETLFMSNSLHNGHQFMLKMMAYPFSGKEEKNTKKEKGSSKKKNNVEVKAVPHYQVKNLAIIGLSAMGTQTFAEDMRYNVSLKIHVNKIDFTIEDRQLSQLLHTFQRLYQFALNLSKNGGKAFSFEQDTQNKYRQIIGKLAREEKLSGSDSKFMTQVINMVPTSMLQEINDDVINQMRFNKQIKKITKVSNSEKSKKMMDELMKKKEKWQGMEGIQIFKQVKILSQIDKVILNIKNKGSKFAELGILGVVIDCVIDLAGVVRVGCKFLNSIFRYKNKEYTNDLYESSYPWMHMFFQIEKQQLTKVHLAVNKKQITLTEPMLANLLDWVSLIRISPSLQNYFKEILQYSIDITRVTIKFLCQKGRQVTFSFNWPILLLQLNQQTKIALKFGHLVGRNSQNIGRYDFEYVQAIRVLFNDRTLFEVSQGTKLYFYDTMQQEVPYQKIVINVSNLFVQNVDSLVPFVYALQKSSTYDVFVKYSSLTLVQSSLDGQFQGQFYLNKVKPKLSMALQKSELIFDAIDEEVRVRFPRQKISLLRTRIYKLVVRGRYFVVFKEEVDKVINIVEGASQKIVDTILAKLSDRIKQLSTSFQWDKYYKKPYNYSISSLQEIQDLDSQNKVLMLLDVHFQHVSLQLSNKSYFKLQQLAALITYHELNTAAGFQLKKVDLIVNQEKIVYDASFRGTYKYLQSMQLQLQILKLGYEIRSRQTISTIIAIASKYQLIALEMRVKNAAPKVVVEQDQKRLQGIKDQINSAQNLDQFLLQSSFRLQTRNLLGTILGLGNKLSQLRLSIQKYRNQPQHRISAVFKGIILLSMIQIPLIELDKSHQYFHLLVDSVNAQLNLELLLYEVLRGEGSLIFAQLLKAYRDRQILKMQSKTDSGQIRKKQEGPDFSLIGKNFLFKLDFLRIELQITSSLSVGFLSRYIQIQKGRFTWTGLILELNRQNISTTYNNGILKWSSDNVDLCMTNCQLKFNSREIIFLSNQVQKIVKYIIHQEFDLVKFAEQVLKTPDDKGRILQKKKKVVNIRVEELQIIYEGASKRPLLSVALKPIFLSNQEQTNTLNISVSHLNSSMKLYQPVIEPFEIKIVEKGESSQLDFYIDRIFLVFTQQLVIDIIEEINLLKEIKRVIEEDEKNQLQQLDNIQVQHIKKTLADSDFKQYAPLDFQESQEYNLVLIITSHLCSKAIVEVNCPKKQKEQLFYNNEVSGLETKTVRIVQKTSYSFSYQLIQRYQKVNLKICIINGFYATSTVTIDFHLYDNHNHYIKPITMVDGNGLELYTNIAVRLAYQDGDYHIDIMGMYSVENCTAQPLFFRYKDHFGMSQFKLQRGEKQSLPLWIIDHIDLGITQDHYCHLVKLRSQIEDDEYYKVTIKVRKDAFTVLIIQKQEFSFEKRQIPQLNQSEGEVKEEQKEQEQLQARLFHFKIIPGLKVRNHLQFPIVVNQCACGYEQQVELVEFYQEQQKQILYVDLGDKTVHRLQIGQLNQKQSVSLQLLGNHYVNLNYMLRANSDHQNIIHFFAQLQLIFNIPHLFVPQVRTNIYQYYYVLQREVKNGYSDHIHPSPVLKDKFVFSTYHYLVNSEERYIVASINGCKSNEVILYHSDFDKDLKFKKKQEEQPEYIYAVSYETKYIQLQNPQPEKSNEILQLNYTYIMPKYYFINKAEQGIVIDSTIVHTGQKVALDSPTKLSLNIRDQLEYHYVERPLKNSNYLMFVKENSESQENKLKGIVKRRQKITHLHLKNNQIIQQIKESESVSKSMQNLGSKEENGDGKGFKVESAPLLEAIVEPTVEEVPDVVQIAQIKEEHKEGENQFLQSLTHCIKMQNIIIFSLSKRVGNYETICYEVNDWGEWLLVKNRLSCPIVLRVKLNDQSLGMQRIDNQQSGRIISGLSQRIEIALCINNEQLVLGTYDLTKRLNHTIFLNDFEEDEIVLKQLKVKVGRQMVIESHHYRKDKNIYKVLSSINFDIGNIIVSFILHQQNVRKELIRLNIMHSVLMLLYYRNGLYMINLKLQALHGIFKKMLFLIVRDVESYIEGQNQQFVERASLSVGETVNITVTDDIIVSLIGQFQIFKKYLPKRYLSQREEVMLQQQQTYHINSLGVKDIQIKLCLRKVISSKHSHQSRILEHYGLSMIEVQDAIISLPEVDINLPLKTHHINDIAQMYAIQSLVGIASGLNILGNPAQFKSEFRAARNRGGVFPFCRAIFAGISNSISKIVGTIGSGFSQLTFDQEFMRNRFKDKSQKAESFASGLKMGLIQFGYSVGSGITGVVEQPAIGFQEEGGVGMLKGTVFGLTGLVTKPVTGLILAISKTIEGLNSTFTNLEEQSLVGKDLIVRPLYHKFKMVRPYRSEDELAYNILLNWYDYDEVQLVGSYILENQDHQISMELLIITCSQLILIDLHNKSLLMKLKMSRLVATAKFLEGVVVYFWDGKGEESQDQVVFRMRRDGADRQNLYWTLKYFIGLYVT